MNTPLRKSNHPFILTKIESHLDGVIRRSNGGLLAKCPGHDDKNQSLAVGVGMKGQVIFKCFAGCTVDEIVGAMGLTISDLYPDNSHSYEKQTRSGFSAWQLLNALEKDLLVVLIAINRYLIEGERPCQSDVDYLTEVCKRINEALQYLEGRK